MKKRVIAEVSDRFHDDLKRRASRKNISMKDYIISALIDYMKREYESDTV
jgi:hypothetical protein